MRYCHGMKLGEYTTPEEWVAVVKARGFTSSHPPVGEDASDEVIAAYVKAAEENDIVINEVGAWRNMMDPNPAVAADAEEFVLKRFRFAEKIGAKCFVTIAGSRGSFPGGLKWSHADNFSKETFDMTVKRVQYLIDTVQPTKTYFTVEPMPTVFPHTTDSYLELLEAVDRERFAVHADIVNMLWSVDKYYNNTEVTREFFKKLGKYVKACHIKDVVLTEGLPLQLCETCPGRGHFDIGTYLEEIDKLDPDMPLILEHQHKPELFEEGWRIYRRLRRKKG